MGLEETKEPGAFRQPRKQRPIIACQPAIEGPVPHTFRGMQQPQGDDLTGPEMGLGMCGDRAQLLIDLIADRNYPGRLRSPVQSALLHFGRREKRATLKGIPESLEELSSKLAML